MKTTLLLIAVAILCVGCNEEALKKKDQEIAAQKATHAEEIAALKAEKKAAVAATIAKFRPPGPDMPGMHRRLALPIEVGAGALFAVLVVMTIKALLGQMTQIDRRHGWLIGWIMILVGIVATVAASMVSPVWAGLPYTPVLWFTSMARPTSGWANLITILLAALASFGVAYFLMKLRGSEIPKECKWGCSLIILALTFFGSHYKLACFSVIWNIGASTGYLIYPLSVGEVIGGLLGTAAYLIGNPVSEPSENEQQAQPVQLTPEFNAAKWTDDDEAIFLSRYLSRFLELLIRMVGTRH